MNGGRDHAQAHPCNMMRKVRCLHPSMPQSGIAGTHSCCISQNSTSIFPKIKIRNRLETLPLRHGSGYRWHCRAPAVHALGLSWSTARSMRRKIRQVMAHRNGSSRLANIIELDGAIVGGKRSAKDRHNVAGWRASP